MSSQFILSPTATGSSQYVLSIREGEAFEIDSRTLPVATATYSDRATATRLTLLGWSESPRQDATTAGGFSVIKATSKRTGYASFIPLGTQLESYDGGYSSGASAITVSTSGSGETLSLEYDPSTFGSSSLPCAVDASETRYFSVPVVGDQLTPPAAAEAARLVVVTATGSGFTYLGARTGSPEDLMLARMRAGGVNGEVVGRVAGHWVSLSATDAVVAYEQAPTTGAAFLTKWNLYLYFDATATGARVLNATYATLVERLFASAAPASGTAARTDLASAAGGGISLVKASPRATACVKLLFNVTEVFGPSARPT